MKKFKVVTYGCQMNKHDSSVIEGVMIESGYTPITVSEKPNIIIFNTCTVRKSAEDKFYGHLGLLKHEKKADPSLIIAVGGCLAQDQQDYIAKRARHVDIVFGTLNFHELPKLIKDAGNTKRSILSVNPGDYDFNDDVQNAYKNIAKTGKVSELVTIMVGCNNFCTYCIVPMVRGREVSRDIEDVLGQVKALSESGVKEITLLGQNVNSYGKDLNGSQDFATLLEKCANVKGIDRIRFTTSHPKDLTKEIIDVMKEHKNICKSLHLPFQSGSDIILSSMNRKYSRDHYLDLVSMIRNAVPGISLTADVIVGFPGETEEDFEQTLDLVSRVRFDQLFMFLYSARDKTKASGMVDTVPHDIKLARFKKLEALQTQISLENNQKFAHKVVEVLCEGPSKTSSDVMTGRTDCNKVVHFPGKNVRSGEKVDVLIDVALSHYLKGSVNVKAEKSVARSSSNYKPS